MDLSPSSIFFSRLALALQEPPWVPSAMWSLWGGLLLPTLKLATVTKAYPAFRLNCAMVKMQSLGFAIPCKTTPSGFAATGLLMSLCSRSLLRSIAATLSPAATLFSLRHPSSRDRPPAYKPTPTAIPTPHQPVPTATKTFLALKTVRLVITSRFKTSLNPI